MKTNRKGGSTVRIPIIAKLDSPDDRERYLAHVLRNGLYVDEKKVQFLKGNALLEYLAFYSLSQIDKDYLSSPGSTEAEIQPKTVKEKNHTPPAEDVKKKPKRIEIDPSKLDGIVF